MPKEPNQTQENNNVLNPVARHNSRRYALQAMYQWQISGTTITELEDEFLRYHIDKKIDLPYFKELIHGVPKLKQEIDYEIQPFLGRSLSEVDPIELAVLRLAIYELISDQMFLIE